jgi:hypothetical protein
MDHPHNPANGSSSSYPALDFDQADKIVHSFSDQLRWLESFHNRVTTQFTLRMQEFSQKKNGEQDLVALAGWAKQVQQVVDIGNHCKSLAYQMQNLPARFQHVAQQWDTSSKEMAASLQSVKMRVDSSNPQEHRETPYRPRVASSPNAAVSSVGSRGPASSTAVNGTAKRSLTCAYCGNAGHDIDDCPQIADDAPLALSQHDDVEEVVRQGNSKKPRVVLN